VKLAGYFLVSVGPLYFKSTQFFCEKQTTEKPPDHLLNIAYNALFFLEVTKFRKKF